MVRWEQDFDVYLADLDGAPASFVVDLATREHAPVASHGRLLTLRVPMRLERPDGLRHHDELEPLGAIEDQVVDRLTAGHDAIYAGRVVTQGTTTLYFYLPADRARDVDDLVATVGALPEGYELGAVLSDDAGWQQALAMVPGAYAEQTIWNRRLVRIFEERGDSLDLAREVDHMAYFPSRADADRAAIDLRASGFRVDDVSELDDGKEWGLAFHRDDTLAAGRPDEFVAEIFEILQRHRGRYDGWGAEQRTRDR
jgi:regulator of RNase E activity RraB